MAIYIDDGTVMRMIHTALLAVTGVEVIVLGEEIPDTLDVVVILMGLTLARQVRVRNVDAAMASLSVQVDCVCGPGQASTSSIGELAAKVAKAFDTVTALVDADSGHVVEFGPPSVQIGMDLGDNPGNKMARITCEGLVRRSAGETIAAFIS